MKFGGRRTGKQTDGQQEGIGINGRRKDLRNLEDLEICLKNNFELNIVFGDFHFIKMDFYLFPYNNGEIKYLPILFNLFSIGLCDVNNKGHKDRYKSQLN